MYFRGPLDGSIVVIVVVAAIPSFDLVVVHVGASVAMIHVFYC